MGPRLFSRGMPEVVRLSRLPEVRFNGAAAVQPRNATALAEQTVQLVRLQWGRGCSAAEWTATSRSATVSGPASMGPRLFSRGMFAGRVSLFLLNLASMGPRLFSRGMDDTRWRCPAYRHASMGPRLFSRGMRQASRLSEVFSR